MKLIRITRLGYVRFLYKGIVTYASNRQPKVGKLIDYIITQAVEGIFWLHLWTCLWIKIGSLDARDERWRTKDQNEISWMFIEGSDFSADPRNIYE